MDKQLLASVTREAAWPALIGFVIGVVAGVVAGSVWAGIALGAVLAFSSVLRRYTAAKMQQRIDDAERANR